MSKSAKTLNDILKNFQDVEIKLIEEEGEISSDVEKMIAQNDLSLADKLDGYEKFTRYLKGQVEYLNNMEDHYNKRRKILENSIKRCKESMLVALTSTDKHNIKTKEFNFSLGKSEKWTVDSSLLSIEDKKRLVDNGYAENLFKINLSKIKGSYKDKEIPEWIDVQENSFIRVF